MRKRFSIIIFVLCIISCKVLAFSDQDARAIAVKFYRNLQTIAEEKYTSDNPNTDASMSAQETSLGLCWNRSINLPNEFYQFGFKGDDAFLYAQVYMQRLREFAFLKQGVKYTPEIQRIQAYTEIKAAKSENSTNFYNVYVSKTISAGGISKVFLDTVLVCVEQGGKIAKITNFTSGISSGESVISLRGKAAELFSQKKYQEAYDTYLKVIKKDFKQGDAYYRLGLMAYHNLGCKNRFRNKSARLKQAYEYIKLAEEHGNYEIKVYARRVKYYMENGSV